MLSVHVNSTRVIDKALVMRLEKEITQLKQKIADLESGKEISNLIEENNNLKAENERLKKQIYSPVESPKKINENQDKVIHSPISIDDNDISSNSIIKTQSTPNIPPFQPIVVPKSAKPDLLPYSSESRNFNDNTNNDSDNDNIIKKLQSENENMYSLFEKIHEASDRFFDLEIEEDELQYYII